MVTEAPKGDGRIKIREGDQHSNNPELRKRYWLATVRERVTTVGDDIAGRVLRISDECQGIMQDGGTWEWQWPYVSRLTLLPYQERADALLAEVGDIVHQKGFIFRNALTTPREHVQIGSTSWIGYLDADPDVPVPLVHDRLLAQGEERLKGKEPYGYTIEELDRARRLSGMTRLDLTTGKATEEKDPDAAHDSYHFLSPEKRAEIITREQAILQELTALTEAGVKDFESVSTLNVLIAQYMEGRLTSPQMQELYQRMIIGKGFELDLSRAIREAKQIAFDSGKWDRILTPQEILLRTKAKTKVPKRYLARPYTPLAIQDGEPIEEIAGFRHGEESMVVNSGVLPYAMPIGFRLEDLDLQGDTVQSPTFLNRFDMTPENSLKNSTMQVNVPFARPEDWYYR